jgi:nucleoside-diphosphate-sugar epimerase
VDLFLLKSGQPYKLPPEQPVSLLLSGGYSPISKDVFSKDQARLAIRELDQIFSLQPNCVEKLLLVSSIDVEMSISDGNGVTVNLDYPAHKLDVELAVESWSEANKVPIAIVRLGPLYGPGEEKYHRLIPTLIRAKHRGENFAFSGPQSFSRNFLYVEDAAKVLVSFFLEEFKTGRFRFEGLEPISFPRLKAAVDLALSQRDSIDLIEKTIPRYRVADFDIQLLEATPFELGIRREAEGGVSL